MTLQLSTRGWSCLLCLSLLLQLGASVSSQASQAGLRSTLVANSTLHQERSSAPPSFKKEPFIYVYPLPSYYNLGKGARLPATSVQQLLMRCPAQAWTSTPG